MKNNTQIQYPYLNIKVGCNIFKCIRSDILNQKKEAMVNNKDSSKTVYFYF